MTEKKLMGLMGLAVRAGQAVLGTEQAVLQVRQGRAVAVLMDAGASENTSKRLKDACAHHEVPIIVLPKGLIGRASGKPGRVAASLSPGELGREILKQAALEENNGDAGNKSGGAGETWLR